MKLKWGRTPLHRALEQGHLETARALLEAGADINITDDGGWTRLHLAARWGETELVRRLLDAGANVNARNDLGETPLYCARDCENASDDCQDCDDDPIEIANITRHLLKARGGTV